MKSNCIYSALMSKVLITANLIIFSITSFGQIGVTSATTDQDAQQRIDAWKRRGGSVGSSMWGVGFSYMEYKDDQFTLIGNGFNGSFGFGGVSLNLPVSSSGNLGSWTATKYELGLEYSYFETTATFDGLLEETTSSYQQLTIPFNLGLGVGLGTGSGLNWKGVALYANWSPSYQITMPEEGEGSETFNASGFTFDIEFTKLEAALDKLVKKPQTRLSVFVLPPADDLPLFVSISIRQVVY